MTPIALHHRMRIHSGPEARSHANHQRGMRLISIGVFLGQNGVDENLRPYDLPYSGLGIDEYRNGPIFPNLVSLFRGRNSNSFYPLYDVLARKDRVGKSHRTTDRSRRRYLGNQDP